MEEGEEGKEKSKNRKTGWSQVYKQLWTYGQPEEEKQEMDFPDGEDWTLNAGNDAGQNLGLPCPPKSNEKYGHAVLRK